MAKTEKKAKKDKKDKKDEKKATTEKKAKTENKGKKEKKATTEKKGKKEEKAKTEKKGKKEKKATSSDPAPGAAPGGDQPNLAPGPAPGGSGGRKLDKLAAAVTPNDRSQMCYSGSKLVTLASQMFGWTSTTRFSRWLRLVKGLRKSS